MSKKKITGIPEINISCQNAPCVNPRILYEDNDILIADKPAGMLSLEDRTGRQSLVSLVSEYLKKSQDDESSIYCAPIHRLDRPVSGAMLFAKNPESAGKLSDDMKNGRVQKMYLAIVSSTVINSSADEWKCLEQYYIRRRDRAYIVEPGTPGASAVSLRYRIIDNKDGYNQVLINLISGKRHQIRVQLSSMGMPVTGDRFYGSGESFEDGIICLHSLSLGFTHPSTQFPINITAPLPTYISEKIKSAAG